MKPISTNLPRWIFFWNVRAGVFWFLRNTNTTGFADIVFTYGLAMDTAIVGDWDGDGIDTPAALRGTGPGVGVWWLPRNSNTTGMADGMFDDGLPGDLPLVWCTPLTENDSSNAGDELDGTVT